MTKRHIARQTLLTRTGLGVGAALSAGFGAGLGSDIAPAQAKDTLGDHVWSQGYWAQKGDVKLAVYRKWLPGAADKGRLRCCFWCTARRYRRCRASI